MRSWVDGGRHGVIVLPTAAGKTHVALEAMREVGGATLVVVPTIDLIDQWVAKLSEVFGVDVGRLGGGESDIKPVTVSTYDSALIRAENLGNRFQFLVVDEVHHLPSPQYRHIAEMYCAPARLGLTATYERADLLHLELEALMGGKLFELGYEELTDYLAEFTLVKVKVELSPEEQEEYDDTHGTFIRYLRSKRMVLRGPWDFEAFIRRSWNPEGREALMAWRRSRELAFNPRAKLEAVRTLLSRHRGARTLIFAEQTDQVYDLGRQLLVPCLTYKTPDEERKELLRRFKEGQNTVLATSRVLDEGVDVPEASVAIVLSGSGSPRQFRQRLGGSSGPARGSRQSSTRSSPGTRARWGRRPGGSGAWAEPRVPRTSRPSPSRRLVGTDPGRAEPRLRGRGVHVPERAPIGPGPQGRGPPRLSRRGRAPAGRGRDEGLPGWRRPEPAGAGDPRPGAGSQGGRVQGGPRPGPPGRAAVRVLCSGGAVAHRSEASALR